jgi:hypothetical protein
MNYVAVVVPSVAAVVVIVDVPVGLAVVLPLAAIVVATILVLRARSTASSITLPSSVGIGWTNHTRMKPLRRPCHPLVPAR